MQSTQTIQQRLAEASEAYYNTGSPIMSDEEFDALVDHARSMGVDVDATVGAPVEGEGTKHPIPMLSLSKFTDRVAARKFLAEHTGLEFIVQPKLDGVSLSLEYSQGKLTRAVTRGDGVRGEDVTNIVRHLPSVPTSFDHPFNGIVRGEVVIHRDELDPKFKNTRNSVSGLLNYRTKSPRDAAKYNCRFYAFDLYGDHITSARDAGAALVSLGFTQPEFQMHSAHFHLLHYVESLLKGRTELPYDIDGVVVKVSSFSIREKLGNRSNSPRWAFAFKEAGQVAETLLLSVTWQTGSNGAVTPVAELDPVNLSGTTISRASLHNPKFIEDKNIKIGDEVIITRAGDVIPYVVGVAGAAITPVEPTTPTECPSCGSTLVQEGNSQQVRCTEVGTCPAQLQGRLVKWAGRDAADIDAIGPAWVEKFVAAGDLTSPADFYNMNAVALSKYEGMGSRNIERFLSSINGSKNLGMRRALIGFCIPNSGEGTAKRLCRHFGSIEEVMAAPVSTLVGIEDIGPIVAQSIHDYFRNEANMQTVTNLRLCGVNLDRLAEDAPAAAGAPLEGKTFVITGKLSVGRSALTKEVEAAGGAVSGSVSAKTTALVTDDPEGTSGKSVKARSLGVPMISEAQLREMMG